MNEKIHLLNETLYLGGIWGSGLTNMLFLNEKTNLIEIRNKNDKKIMLFSQWQVHLI